jgi:dihydroxy-acid dehydratase
MSMGDVGIHSLKKAAEIFPDEPPKNDGTINKHSALLTQDPSRGGVQAYMYALGLTKEDMKKAQICIASVWFEVGVGACANRVLLS